jgi:DNA-binding SARP family transcriptional activator
MEFSVLGPVEAWTAGGDRVPLGPAKVRCVLAVLLRTPGVLVTTEALVDRVWDEHPPGPSVRYKYVGILRAALRPHGVELVSADGGYLLDVDAEQVDLHRFRRLAAAGRAALTRGSLAEAAQLLGDGLRLWRGSAVTGLTGSWAELFRSQLEFERRDARMRFACCALDVGRPAEALEQLTEWEAEYPADEQVVELRMVALYRCGRRTEAVACYHRAEKRLRARLGAGPGPDLRTLYCRIQDQDGALSSERFLTSAVMPD